MDNQENDVIIWHQKKGKGNPYNILPNFRMFKQDGHVIGNTLYDRDYVIHYFKRALSGLYPIDLAVLMEIMEEVLKELEMDENYAAMIQSSLKIE